MRAVQRIVNEMNQKSKYYQYLVVMYYAELLILIYRYLDEAYLPICTNDSLKRAISYIRLNYQSDITISDVASQTGVGERYLRKLFCCGTRRCPSRRYALPAVSSPPNTSPVFSNNKWASLRVK